MKDARGVEFGGLEGIGFKPRGIIGVKVKRKDEAYLIYGIRD